MRYSVVIHKSKYGVDVRCPALPGCHSQGETEQEALDNIKDAIRAYLGMALFQPMVLFRHTGI